MKSLKSILTILLILLFAYGAQAQTTTTILDLTEDTSPTSDDMIYVVNSPGSSPNDRKVTIGNAITKAHGLTADYVPMLNSSGILTSNSTPYWKQVATPANPSSGYNKLYFKSDDKLYKLTSGGSESEIGAGASGKGYLWIPAGTMIPHDCSGLLQSDVDPNIIDYLAFDGTTSESAFFTLSQEDWDLSTIKAKFVWAPSSEDNGQTVQWCLRCYAVSDGDSYDVAFSAGEQCAAADALGASDWSSKNQKITAATSAITVQGTPAAGDVVHCQIYRNVSGDDYEHDAWLIGVKIEYGKTTPSAW